MFKIEHKIFVNLALKSVKRWLTKEKVSKTFSNSSSLFFGHFSPLNVFRLEFERKKFRKLIKSKKIWKRKHFSKFAIKLNSINNQQDDSQTLVCNCNLIGICGLIMKDSKFKYKKDNTEC